jgi:hypothetical protein
VTGLLDVLLSEWRWWRQVRGGRWISIPSTDRFWIRDDSRRASPNPDVEEYAPGIRWGYVLALVLGVVLGLAFAMWAGEMGGTVFRDVGEGI